MNLAPKSKHGQGGFAVPWCALEYWHNVEPSQLGCDSWFRDSVFSRSGFKDIEGNIFTVSGKTAGINTGRLFAAA